MKRFIFLSIILSGLVLFSCKQDEQITYPIFSLSSEYSIDTVVVDTTAEYRVTFNFDENAEIIAFYSGEFGSNYEYRNGHTMSIDTLGFSFTSNCNFGEMNPLKQFSVLVSTNFNGTYDVENISAATWTKVTDRFNIAKLIVNDTQYYPSGRPNLIDVTNPNTNTYIAFRYFTPDQNVYGTYAAVRIRDWNIKMKSEMDSSIVDPAWTLVDSGYVETGRNSITTTGTETITLRGHFNAANKSKATAAWVVSAPLSTSNVDLGADIPTPVKAIGDISQKSFKYRYKKPGIYDAVFVAYNRKTSEEDRVVTKLRIVIP